MREEGAVRFRSYFNESYESDWHFLVKLAVLWRLQKMRRCDSSERVRGLEILMTEPLKMQVNKRLFKGCVVDVYAEVQNKPMIVEVVSRRGISRRLEERLREIKEHFPNSRLVVVTSRRVGNSAFERVSRHAEVWFAEDLLAELSQAAHRETVLSLELPKRNGDPQGVTM